MAGGEGTFLAMKFGDFVSKQLERSGLTVGEFASLLDLDERQLRRWMQRDAPPGGSALRKLADALALAFPELKAIVDAGKDLTPKQVQKWLDSGLVAAAQRRHQLRKSKAQVQAWFESAPAVVQHVVLGQVPEGAEQQYLDAVVEYFRSKLTPRRGLVRSSR